ncbi:hypothetical protein THL1_1225 [Pseudomonas sp. TCU-HL1]|nr:hypothetical protein THL1_1225 [Pseudomonas sp. TCU-HL1]
MQAHLRAHPLERSGEGMVASIQAFCVPNEAPTVWRRIRIIFGVWSNRLEPASCSQRLTRRSVLGVQRSFNAQPWQCERQ